MVEAWSKFRDSTSPSELLSILWPDLTRLRDEHSLLVEFIDIDFKATKDLRSKIENRTFEKIDYADLWHLFHHHEELMTLKDRD